MDYFYLLMSGNYTVIIETVCCIFFLLAYEEFKSSKRFVVQSVLLFTVLIVLQQIPLDSVQSELLQGKILLSYMLNLLVIVIFKLIPMYVYMQIGTSGKWKEAMFIFSQAFACSEFIRAFAWIIYVLIRINTGIRSVILESVIIFGILALSVFVMWKVYGREPKEKAPVSGGAAVFSLLIAYICFAIGNLWGWFFYPNALTTGIEYYYTMEFLIITIYFSGILGLYLMQRVNYEGQMQREMQAASDMLQLRYQQYLDYVANSEYIAKQSHDLKHVIAGMRQQPGAEQWSDYLDEMDQAVKKYDTWNVSGNSVFDAILTQKKQYCSEHDIQLTCNADGKAFDFLSVRDICSLFGNILDNAIEAVSKMDSKDERVIQGEVAGKNNFLLIRFENPCDKNLTVSGSELPETSKDNKKRHGYGLKSIKQAVEKYDGTMKLSARDGWFSIKIMIPMPK